MELIAMIAGGLLSFVGSYSATKVHLTYFRRDIDQNTRDIQLLKERQQNHVF
jgi:hypothetical protein